MKLEWRTVALGATLPPQALRHLVRHAAVHLDVEWRDLRDADWSKRIVAADGLSIDVCETPRARAFTIWQISVELDAGGRIEDAPVDFRRLLDRQDRPRLGWPTDRGDVASEPSGMVK